ncbi:hypothetical protein [Novosphingobium sp.]|uniref:hypothetical protein n=1 Tax=Novosphingobium sp. TaxID=1874826 RepID=UPI001D7BACA8|nr:hypothetical protein [Novosphingobium sp.]MBX9664820.1 hypothetical protein [Novosphingobium sp.]
MNEQLTRVSLAKAGKGQTDWDRLRSLTDAQIDAAIAADDDSFALVDAELAALGNSPARYELRELKSGSFQVVLVSAQGSVLATAHDHFATRDEARLAIRAISEAAIEAARGLQSRSA